MTEINPFDDPSIQNRDELYRRISPAQIEDNRPSAPAFQMKELSVAVARLTTPQATMASERWRDDFTDWKLAGLIAEVPRGLGLLIYMDPSPENPAHAIVWGNKKLMVQRKLADASRWIEWQ